MFMVKSTGPDFQAFLTTEEVLAYLKITPRTIYRLIRNGELPAVRVGRQWRFRRRDLDAWLERQRVVTGPSVG
jgi:excisionase family DNA binding protein